MEKKYNKNNRAALVFLLLAVLPALALAQGPAEADISSLQLQNPATAAFGEFRDSPRLKNTFKNLVPPMRGVGVCGDSAPDPGEECDDGNTSSGDGCSAVCTVEPGFDCTAAVAGQTTENAIGDGSFELDDGSWAISGWLAGRCNDTCSGGTNFASDGEYWIWIGGTGDTANSGSAVQTLNIPGSATNLTFDVLSAASACGDSTVSVDIDGNVLWTYEDQGNGECDTTDPFPYESVDLDISAFADDALHTVTLIGDYVPAGGGANANWFLDNFQMNVPLVPPIPPIPSECTAIVCGDGLLGSTEQCDDGNLINGDGCSDICEIEQPDFICEDPMPPADSGDDIVDGGLEGGWPNAFWESAGVEFDPICSQVFCGAALANTGAFYGWFGGSINPNFQTLTQTTTISVTATDLTFQLLVGICDSANDSLAVEIDGSEVYRYDCTMDNSGYEPVSVALGAFADGNPHTIQFIGNTVAANGGNSNFFVDDISILDNVPFAGLPSQCQELPTACGVIEQFDTFPPAGWTDFNLGEEIADGWGSSTDGVCASANWSSNDPFFNETGGGGVAACADSDATGQADIDAGGPALEMDTYLCSPAMDLAVGLLDPQFTFLANYQAVDNDLNDNGTPGDPQDDFDDDLLEVLVGTAPPNSFTVLNYTSLGSVLDHLDTTLDLSEAGAFGADLSGELGESEVYVCFHYRGTYAWYAQVDNAGLRASLCSGAPDGDGDDIPDAHDNCIDEPNADQRDTDGDGYGNICDGDLNNDCAVNFLDLGIFKSVFFTADADADFNGDGVVNPTDLGIHRQMFFAPPGPGLGSCAAP